MSLYKRSGFTLVEMLVTLFVLSVGVVIVAIAVGTTGTTRDSAYENIAFHIAESKLDELRAAGYSTLPASGPFSDSQLASLPQGSASTTVTTWNAKTKRVATGVAWRGATGATRYVSLTTLITEVGGL